MLMVLPALELCLNGRPPGTTKACPDDDLCTSLHYSVVLDGGATSISSAMHVQRADFEVRRLSAR